MRLAAISPGPLEAQNISSTPDSLEVTPVFYGTGASAVGMVLKVTDNKGKLLSVSAIQVNGRTGKLTLLDRTASVPPACEAETPSSAKP